MTLVISKGITLRKGWQPMDPDAAAYITAVETADTEPLEERTKIAIDNFVLGCKADGIWNAIKASCILAGARTLAGALVPLVGTAPTNVGPFVSGDYNRKTGLVGNGSTKYLNSNRNNNADPQDSKHFALYSAITWVEINGRYFIGSGGDGAGESNLRSITGATIRFRLNQSGPVIGRTYTRAPGLVGASRSNSSEFAMRYDRVTDIVSSASSTASSNPISVFATNNTSSTAIDARLSFYSIGESLDLTLLDARVTDLINAFGAAIP